MVTDRPAPTQQALAALLRAATTIKVLDWTRWNDGNGLETTMVFETNDPFDLASFGQAFEIELSEPFHCMCVGDLLIDLWAGDDTRARLTLHHGESIRWDGWSSDARLRDGRRAVEWLADHGVVKPLRDYEAQATERTAAAEARRRWRLAMPPCLRAFLPGVMQNFFSFEATPEEFEGMDRALQSAYGSADGVVTNLLEWFGQGEGAWSGFPAYEAMAEKLVLRYPTAVIVRALNVGDLATHQLEGAARLFSSFTFRKQRGQDLISIPADLKARLETHMRTARLADNRERFERALSG
jgi:hypothetical protein